MPLKQYKIEIPESDFMTMVHAVSPEKALKEAAKIQFERRGRYMFVFDKRQFINATALVNYAKKTGKISEICKEVQPL